MAQKVTEEEAKEKWCRHARQFHNRDGGIMVSSAAINRDKHTGTGDTKCYGSDCMAWEWDEENNNLFNLKEDKRKGFCDAENNGGKIAIM